MDRRYNSYGSKAEPSIGDILLHHPRQQRRRTFALGMFMLLTAMLFPACSSPVTSANSAPALAEELKIYGWEGYMPQSLLDDFTAEYGVAVNYVSYGETEEA